jgi:exo-beta-1,3-glucanase (GH17 family)
MPVTGVQTCALPIYESWKVGSEGDVGSYWGIWDKDEQLKF